MSSHQQQPKNNDVKPDIQEVEELTPFTRQELKGKRFKSGNMLGGAMPLQADEERVSKGGDRKN